MDKLFKITFDDNDHTYIIGESQEQLEEKWLNKSVPIFTDEGLKYKKIVSIKFHQMI